MPTPIKNGTSLSRYRSVWEMRADGWINLVDDLSRLAILPPDDRNARAAWRTCTGSLNR